jgi:hypothetical protein
MPHQVVQRASVSMACCVGNQKKRTLKTKTMDGGSFFDSASGSILKVCCAENNCYYQKHSFVWNERYMEYRCAMT